MAAMANTLDVTRVPVRQRIARQLGGRRSPTGVRVALILVVFGFIVLSSVIAVKTPPWQSSDEPEHVRNIETLVSGHWYGMNLDCRPKPSQASLTSCAGDEAQQAPLYYMLMAGWQDLVGLPAEPPPQQYPDQSFLLLLRFPNIVLGAATVIMSFLAARLMARDVWTPVIAAGLIAFLPRLVFLSAFVSNDNLVNFFGAILTFCALRFNQRVTSQWMIATGAVFGLLVTTKLSVLPLALVIPFLALLGPTWRRRLWLAACGSLSALVVSAWYLVQNWVRYGDPLARHVSAVYLGRIGGVGEFFYGVPIPYVVTNPLNLVFIAVPTRIVTGFWYQSDWGRYQWSALTGLIITGVVVVLLLCLIHQRISKRVLAVLGTISVLSFASVWLLAFQTATYQARYALVGLSAMASLLALALQRFPVWVRWMVPAAGLVGCVIAVQQDVLGVHWT
jgi:4-amino-4-deoxy-L-arabinose transferase-like glycosyltransferase